MNAMAVAMKENYTLHKLHSLTGVIPVGYYLVQHLTLNTFSLAGPTKFNAIIQFFEGMPIHFLWAVKLIAIWIPLIFHAVYGIFILSHAKYNYGEPKYRFKENGYFTFQRGSGIVAFLFLVFHMTTTSVNAQVNGAKGTIYYDHWADMLSRPVLGIPYFFFAVYTIGILACAYHFSYGFWSFCIRWGFAISEKAQQAVWKLSNVMFPVISLLGIFALYGFFNPVLEHKENAPSPTDRAVETVTMR
jgi:succinate dehydrogenase / fumarate reductase cytochrome b subunit